MRVLRDRIREKFSGAKRDTALWKAAAALITVIAPQNTKEDETTAVSVAWKAARACSGERTCRSDFRHSAETDFCASQRDGQTGERSRPESVGSAARSMPNMRALPKRAPVPVVCYRARSFSVNGRMEWMISPRNLPASGTEGK